jgi:hypothetical protein
VNDTPQTEGQKRVDGKKGKPQVSMGLLFGGIFAFLAAWAGLLGNLGHTSWMLAACVMLAASVCAALGLRLELRNHHWLKWKYNGVACLVVVIGFVLGVRVFIEAFRNEPKKPAEITKWLPPELPQSCSNVVLWFGGEGHIYPVSLLQQFPPAPASAKVPIKTLPPGFSTNLNKLPNYSPRIRNIFLRSDIEYRIGGKTVSYPISPHVISNRLFVDVEIPFLNERRTILMSDDVDSELTQLPGSWDRNYSTVSNIYEVVNEQTNPVLQVIYKAANEVLVNGIFFGNQYDVYASFGGIPALIPTRFRFVENQTTQDIDFAAAQRRFTNLAFAIDTNEAYGAISANQKAIFKYPSNIHPGEFAK